MLISLTHLMCMIPDVEGKVFPEVVGETHIHLARRKVRLAECGRQTGSGGLGDPGMNHRRIGAWQ